MKRILIISLGIIALMLDGCRKPEEEIIREGYTPIYLNKQDAYNIRFIPPKAVEYPGKIYVKDSLIYLVEKNEGIHVIKNSDPRNPEIIGFLKIGGIKNLSIKSYMLYAENFTDIVAIDISNIESPKVLKRIKNINPIKNIMAPEADGWFKCADTTQGYVIGWRKQTIKNPKCYKGIDPEIE